VTALNEVRAPKIVAHGEQDVVILDGPNKKVELQYGADLIQESLNGTDQSVHRADSVGRILQTKDSKGNWVTREEITGGVDVAEHRIRNCVAKIIPASAGADALVVRNYADSEDRIALTEDGKILLGAGRDVALYRVAADVLKTDDNLDALALRIGGREVISSGRALKGIASVAQDLVPDAAYTRNLGSGSYPFNYIHARAMYLYWQCWLSTTLAISDKGPSLGGPSNRWGEVYFGKNLIADSDAASSTTTLVNSPPATFRGAYWDAAAGASKDRDAAILHRMLSTTPTSEIAFQIAGVDKLCIGDTYVDAKGLLFKNARLPCVSKGLTAVTVTETSLALKQSIAPDTGFYGFAYVEGVRVTASNPTGSGVTLYFQVKALLDDGTEADLSDVKSVAEGGSFDDWLRWIYDAVGNGRTIREIRLYAYCSATPAAGYEPTVNLAKVTGVQV
jgi:hypothetical protein